MSYLSRRTREIRQEEYRRAHRVTALNITVTPYNADGSLDYPRAMKMFDPSLVALRGRAIDRYERILQGRNPMGYVSPFIPLELGG